MAGNQITVIEARGLVAQDDQGIDSRWCVIGNSSIGSVGLSLLYGNPTPAITAYGYGDGIDGHTHILSRSKIPGAFCKAPNTTAGSYGTIDVGGVTGTALISNDATSAPFGAFDAWIRTDTGFTPGTTGGAVSTSLDGGINWNGPFNVGTATTYTTANSGVKFLFEPPAAQVTVLVSYANAIRTAALAHFPYTTGTVHGAADSTSDDNVHAAATNQATAILVLTTVYDALVLHFARGTTVHLTADITTSLAAALAAKTAVVASGTAQDAITLALLLETALETHEGSTVAHTVADNVNVVSATPPTRGTLAAGDVAKVRTAGPKWAAVDLYDGGQVPPTGAFQSLKTADTSFGLIYIEGAMSASECATVSTALDVLNAAGRRPTVIVHTRRQTSGETEAEWIASVKADFASFTDDRIVVWAGEGLVIDPVTARNYLRTIAPALVARAVSVARSVQPGSPSDQQLEGVSLTDSNGDVIGHDDGPSGDFPAALDAFRFATAARGETTATRKNVYCKHPYVMRPTDGRVFSLQVRRVLNALELAAAEVSFASLGDRDFFDVETGLFEETTRNAIAGMIRAPLALNFATDIQNPNAPDLVTVAPAGTSSNGNVTAYVTIAPRPFLYRDAVQLTFALQVA